MSGAELRAQREALRLTQPALATVLGVELRVYQRWEAGDAKVPGPVRQFMRWLETGARPPFWPTA